MIILRYAGLLMAVSSLPNRLGVGDFGPQTYQFIDYLHKAKVKIWQILPLGPLGFGSSPYQSYSSYAMDEIYISLDLLKKDGLIKGDIPKFNDKKNYVDFGDSRKFKKQYLLEAYNNFVEDNEYRQFVKKHFWLEGYAYFMASKRVNSLCIWHDWKNIPSEDNIRYEKFLQFILYKQWFKLKKYANDMGIQIMGDLPIYVGLDSEDVYSNRKVFMLDEDNYPTLVAGVPPDYFSPTGQRWGNPIYNWEYLKKTSFKFLKDRIEQNCKIFDILRIDHFRAFDTYWAIDAKCDTAIDGKWCFAPGYQFFDYLFKVSPHLKIVVEDLGDIREEVRTLRDHYAFKGMKVLQFSYTVNPLFKDDCENLIIYTGTHDNETLKGWFYNHTKEDQKQIRLDLQNHKINKFENIIDNLIYYTFTSGAKIAIVPMQDILHLDNKARMNTPSTCGFPNWTFRITDYKSFAKRLDFLYTLIKSTRR